MSKKLILILLITIIIIVVLWLSSNLEKVIVAKHEQKDVPPGSSESIVDKNSTKYNQQYNIEPTSQYISELNSQLIIDLGSHEDSKIKEVIKFTEKSRVNANDVIEKIHEYFDNLGIYQIQVTSVLDHCPNLKSRVKETEKELFMHGNNFIEADFNFYYFNKGLLESGLCNKNRNQDPFFLFLELARSGDSLAQLLMINHLYSAIARDVINIKQQPLEYMFLRDEIIGYLSKLSSRGLIRATEILASEYEGRGLLPEDRVLKYYYVYRKLKQMDPTRGDNRLRSYDYLTDKQKTIVDRMTENL